MSTFRFPGGDSRTLCIGQTGSGKSTCGVWLLAHQRFDKRPWVVIDFKQELLFDLIGIPPIQQIGLGTVPRRPGLYLISPRPDQEEQLESWLWRVWEKGNCGLFVDEATLMPDKDAFRAILQQGRSKRIPLIAATQRPVDVKRGLFSEASFFCVYRMADRRDYKTVEGFIPADLSMPMPAYHWHYYDVARNTLLHMGPVPRPQVVADLARERIPHVTTWHPFRWTATPTGRPDLKRA